MSTLRSFAKRIKSSFHYRLKRFLGINSDQVGASKVGDAKAYEQKQTFQYNFLLQHGLKPEHSLLDIGCGVLRGGLPLVKYLERGNFYGIDIRKGSIKIGKQQVRKNGLKSKKPCLISHKNLKDLNLKRSFDFLWAFSVLIHLTDDKLEECLAFAARHMHDQSVFYANVNTQEIIGKWQNFPVVWHTLDEYQEIAAKYGLKVKNIGTLKDHGHQSVTNPKEDEQTMLLFTR